MYLETQCEIEAVDFAKVEQLSQATRMEYYHARMKQCDERLSGTVGYADGTADGK